MEEEIFKPIPGYEGLYEVSNFGNVASLNYAKRKGSRQILKPGINQSGNGYLFVGLHKKGKSVSRQIHSLVLEAFVGPYPENSEIRHLDGNKRNCKLNNLEYGTTSQNHIDKTYHGTQHTQKLSFEQVLKIYEDSRSQIEIAKEYGVSQHAISSIKIGKNWGHFTGKKFEPRRKLSEEVILSIYKDPRPSVIISKEYGLSKCLVSYIKTGKQFSDITGKVYQRKNKPFTRKKKIS